jgi:hypothetical protein
MDRASVSRWVADYEQAWRTPDGPQLDHALAALFAPDATYRTAPFEGPFRGLVEIGRLWRENRNGPDEEFGMSFEVVAFDPERSAGVVRLEILYGPSSGGQVYRDLWVLRFDAAGRCSAFEEWPFWPVGTAGTYAPGPTRPASATSVFHAS